MSGEITERTAGEASPSTLAGEHEAAGVASANPVVRFLGSGFGRNLGLIIALAVVALLAFNVAMWRRMRAVLRDAKAREERDGGSAS